ncbi:prepilin-type N-terminal cleavage/methylation domain-containing protein [Psychrobacillus psychrotolerans]|uniref:prepilin-type N-terminal cleavage/methylation domain-containing protein n=1 Tax=Psychrobacillus psychrotolerans TaxID=126156 RepID=UPI003B02B56D
MIKRQNEKAFTLVEVVASLVLLSIILLSFFQIFIQTNRVANMNTEKLVIINLADAQLERLQVDSTELKTIGINQLAVEKGVSLNPILLNNKTYNVNVKLYPNSKDENLKLYNIVVTVTTQDGKTKSSVEGYITL